MMQSTTDHFHDVSGDEASHGSAWEGCCEALEAELARQRRVLDLCKEQGRAARARDIASLETATRDLLEVVEEVVHAEHARHRAVRAVVDAYALDAEAQNLTGLAAVAPRPWRARLKTCQAEFQDVVRSTQAVVRANRRFMRHGARAADRLLAELFGREPQTDGYTSDGAEPAKAPAEAALLNTAG